MDELNDYPLAPFVNALRTVVGRICLVVLAFLFGAFLGGITVTDTWSGGLDAILAIGHLSFISFLFTGTGIIALPAIVLFAILFPRSNWPLWLVSIVVALMWWNTHRTIHWVLHESGAAKMQKRINDALKEATKEKQETEKTKAEQ